MQIDLANLNAFEKIAAYQQDSTEVIILKNANENKIKDLIKFATSSALRVSLQILGYEKHQFQQELDELIWENRKRYYDSLATESLHSKPKLVRPRRTRPFAAKSEGHVAVDTEVEQQTVSESAHESEQEVHQVVNHPPRYLPQISCREFVDLLIETSPVYLTRNEILQLWFRIKGEPCILVKEEGVKVELIDLTEAEHLNKLETIDLDLLKTDSHPYLQGISWDAARAIAQNPQQFAFGFDKERLPQGFNLIPTTNNPSQFTLDFTKVNPSTQHDCTVFRHLPASRCGIAKSAAEALLQKASPARRRQIEGLIRSIAKQPHYSKDLTQIIRHYLPTLIRLNDEAFNGLIAISRHYDSQEIQGKQLLFFLENQKRIQKIEPQSVWMPFYLGEKFSELRAFANDTNSFEVSLDTHPWSKNHPDLEFLKSLDKYYQFNTAQLDSLWRVEATQGRFGLNQVLQFLENNRITSEKTDSTSDSVKSYVHHLQDLALIGVFPERCKKDLDRIKTMSSEELLWWTTLMDQHTETVGQDDIHVLLNEFKQFGDYINQLGLRFYSPVEFQYIRSLPVALARMRRILNNCAHSEDLQAQWRCISGLPLQANGAILALEQSTADSPCQFVLPAMQLNATHYEFSESGNGYHTVRSLNEVRIMSDSRKKAQLPEVYQEAEMNMFRFLSRQPYRASLEFYWEAIAKSIRTHKLYENLLGSIMGETCIGYAYRILAGCSVGASNAMSVRLTAKRSLAGFDEIIRNYSILEHKPSWIPLKGLVRAFVMEGPASLAVMPDYERLFVIIHAQNAIMKELQLDPSWFKLFTKVRGIQDKLSVTHFFYDIPDVSTLESLLFGLKYTTQLNQKKIQEHAATLVGISSYLNGQDLLADDSKEQEQFAVGGRVEFGEVTPKSSDNVFNEASKAFTINPQIGNDAVTVNAYSAIAGLISTFDITSESIRTIRPEQLKNQTTIYALKLLRNLKTKEGLCFAKLARFIQDLPPEKQVSGSHRREIDYEKVTARLTQHFPDYFEPDFLSSLQGEDLDSQTLELINTQLKPGSLKDKLIAFLRRFPKFGDASSHRHNNHDALLHRLLGLSKALDERQDEFLEALISGRCFSVTTLQQISALLDVFEKQADKNAWLFALRAIERDFPQIQEKQVAFDTLNFWLNHFQSQLIRRKLDQHLSATVSNLLFKAFHKARKQEDGIEDEIELTRYNKTWVEFSELVITNKLAESSLVDLLEKLVARDDFSLVVMQQFCRFFKMAAELDILSVACWFADGRDDLFFEFIKANQGKEALYSKFISVLKIQANLKADLSLEVMNHFMDSDKLEQIQVCYNQAPYPDLNLVKAWFDEGQDVCQAYEKFTHKPCERIPANGFDFHQAQLQVKKFNNHGIETQELIALHNWTKLCKAVSLEQLKSHFDQAVKENNFALMTACAAELLYRAMGQPKDSYEINTTQYLEVYALLKHQGPIEGGIASGEGKTRVFMLLAAIHRRMGKTIDFITSNMTLATREYMEYQPYFDLIGANTALITSNCNTEDYRANGIHFSDVAQLSLFRNQQASRGINTLPANSGRALLLDEGDQTLFDAFQSRYNYSSAFPHHQGDLIWVYPLLIEFFSDRTNQELYHTDIDACNDKFRFLVNQRVNDTKRQQFMLISDAQIELWHDAAIHAMKLEYLKDFILIPDEVMILPGEGKQVYSRAAVVKNNREVQGSSFANGVQQCLHALLNRIQSLEEGSSKLKEDLKKCQHPFVLRPENRIIYTSNSHHFLQNYKDGVIIALTGTPGNQRERLEAESLYWGMKCIDFPRHNPLRRIDKPLRLTKNKQSQLQAIIEEVKEAQFLGQPVLILCENDAESDWLHGQLKNLAGLDEDKLTRIHAGTNKNDEQNHISKKARLAGQVTVSTDMLARGVNISLTQETKSRGLNVIGTWLPTERDLTQLVNRAGRYGDVGSSRLILDKTRVKKLFPTQRIPNSFFIHTDIPVKQTSDLLDRKQQLQRLVTFAASELPMQLQQIFYTQYCPKEEGEQRSSAIAQWSEFLQKVTLLWEDYQRELTVVMNAKVYKEAKARDIMNRYGDAVLNLWDQLMPDYDISELKAQDKPQVNQVVAEVKKMKAKFHASHQPFFHRYERAHDGFSVRYDHAFAQWRANFTQEKGGFSLFHGQRRLFANTRAAFAGEGILFANLYALLTRKISLWSYLFPVNPEKCQDYQVNTAHDKGVQA